MRQNSRPPPPPIAATPDRPGWLECLGGPRDPCSRQNRRKPNHFRRALSPKRLCDGYSSQRGPIVRTMPRGPPRVSYRGDGCLLALLTCKAGCTAAFAAFGAETYPFSAGPCIQHIGMRAQSSRGTAVKTTSRGPQRSEVRLLVVSTGEAKDEVFRSRIVITHRSRTH
jgi:hypothetical protein